MNRNENKIKKIEEKDVKKKELKIIIHLKITKLAKNMYT